LSTFTDSRAEPEKQTQKDSPEWSDLEMEPCGTARFCREWEEAWEAGNVGDGMVDLMERAIQSCQTQKIPVPPPFYKAKHELEKNAEPDEISKVAGYREPTFPSHLMPD
jgi:hypothetical protein